MSLIWIAAAGFLVWYLVTHRSERPVWAWAGLGLLALPLLLGSRMHGSMMGRGMSRGMMQGMGGMGGMHGSMMGRGGHMMGSGPMASMLNGPWTWVAMAVHAVIVLGLVILAAVLLVKLAKAYAKRTSPLAVLDMRLAKGEVTPEEYEAARSKLAPQGK